MSESSASNEKKWPVDLEVEALRVPNCTDRNAPQSESISLASVWQMESPENADAALAGTDSSFVYRRDGHPNERTLASKLAKLHGADNALLTAQGMSSLSAIGLAILKPGAVVWIADELYGQSVNLFARELEGWGARCESFDPTCAEDLQRLSQSQCDLVLVETISNPRLKVVDLPQLANLTHQAGGLLAVDNTFATHLLCRPLDHGADIVVESLGKQVNGHSDVMLGLIVAKDPVLHSEIRRRVSTFGLASSPLDCYLTQRGLMTLALRLERACSNTNELANALAEHKNVRAVDYPGLQNHPQHEQATQMLSGGFGWMLTMHLDAGLPVQCLFSALAPDIAFVPSLGDVCTSLSHPETTSHRGYSPEERERLGIFTGTIRVSCGIEPPEWLVSKFVHA
ncbi:MAG: aminotransferase class I/II-fold pyridoxal phosphate-dependent enzyme, partial [Planctomycetota bacterium]